MDDQRSNHKDQETFKNAINVILAVAHGKLLLSAVRAVRTVRAIRLTIGTTGTPRAAGLLGLLRLLGDLDRNRRLRGWLIAELEERQVAGEQGQGDNQDFQE